MSLDPGRIGGFLTALGEMAGPVGSVWPCAQRLARMSTIPDFAATRPYSHQPIPVNNEAFQLFDDHTGEPLAHARYRIVAPSGEYEGVTDQEGRTLRVYTGFRVEQIEVIYLPPDTAVTPSSGDDTGCE